jgi:hypothetical protein
MGTLLSLGAAVVFAGGIAYGACVAVTAGLSAREKRGRIEARRRHWMELERRLERAVVRGGGNLREDGVEKLLREIYEYSVLVEDEKRALEVLKELHRTFNRSDVEDVVQAAEVVVAHRKTQCAGQTI